jgi:hypothetical protein
MKVSSLCILFILSNLVVKSQWLVVTARTFKTDDSRMGGVTIQIWEDNRLVTTQKTEEGMVWLYNCKYGKTYKFTYTAKGYLVRNLVFDLHNIPAEMENEKASIDVDMTMYKKKELSACKTKLANWEALPSSTLVFDKEKNIFVWTGEEGRVMKNEMEQCRVK